MDKDLTGGNGEAVGEPVGGAGVPGGAVAGEAAEHAAQGSVAGTAPQVDKVGTGNSGSAAPQVDKVVARVIKTRIALDLVNPADVLNALTEQAGTQALAADMLGVSPSYFNDVAKGRRKCSNEFLKKLGLLRIIVLDSDELRR